VIPIRREEPIELDEAERRALSDTRPVDGFTRLLPLNRLAALRHQIANEEAPAGQQVAAKVVAVLAGCLKMPGSNVIAQPEMFIRQMPEVLADQPTDALWAAAWQVRCTMKYIPAPAELRLICEDIRRPRHQMLRTIEAMEEEHGRRRQAAQREAEREAERERERERLRRLEARFFEIFGDDAPMPGDVELASSLSPTGAGRRGGKLVSWRNALADGEVWAAVLCRRLALVERAKRAHAQGLASEEETIAIAARVVSGENTARRLVEDIEPRIPAYPAGRRTRTLWPAVRNIEMACGFYRLGFDEDPDDPRENAIACLRQSEALADTRAVLDRQAREQWEERLQTRQTSRRWVGNEPPADLPIGGLRQDNEDDP